MFSLKWPVIREAAAGCELPIPIGLSFNRTGVPTECRLPTEWAVSGSLLFLGHTPQRERFELACCDKFDTKTFSPRPSGTIIRISPCWLGSLTLMTIVTTCGLCKDYLRPERPYCAIVTLTFLRIVYPKNEHFFGSHSQIVPHFWAIYPLELRVHIHTITRPRQLG